MPFLQGRNFMSKASRAMGRVWRMGVGLSLILGILSFLLLPVGADVSRTVRSGLKENLVPSQVFLPLVLGPSEGEPADVHPCEFVIVKTADPLPVLTSSPLHYTLTFTNTGMNSSETVIVTDALPSGIAAVQSIGQGGMLEGNTVVWTLPYLEAGHSSFVTFTVQTAGVAGTAVNGSYSVTSNNAVSPAYGEAVTTTVLSPKVVVNEIMQNSAAGQGENGEWFELYNATSLAVDIDGWTIRDAAAESHVIDHGGPLVIPSLGYLVLGRNGGAEVDYVYGSDLTLEEESDEIILLDAAGYEIDRVAYAAFSPWPHLEGSSMELFDPALDNNAGSNWVTATVAYDCYNRGTPGGANGEDTRPPLVCEITPPDGEASAGVNTPIRATFSEAVVTDTLTFTLTDPYLPVAGLISYDTTSFTFYPDNALNIDTPYTATIAAGLEDAAGNATRDDYTWGFATWQDADPPQVIFTSPAHDETDVALNATAGATFNEVVITSTLAFTLTGPHGPVAGLLSPDATSFVFYPDNALNYGTPYTATIAAGLEDTAGNATADDYTWRFTTWQDADPPRVACTEPANGESGVLLEAIVRATFSEDMDESTVTPGVFTLAAEHQEPVEGTFSYDDSTYTLTFDPLGGLAYGTTYVASISGSVRDPSGNAMGDDYTWRFATVPDPEPPQVISTVPDDGAVDVVLDVHLIASFNEAIRPETLTFTLTGPAGPVNGSAGYDPASFAATFDPDGNLSAAALYTATLDGDVTDLAGNPMGSDYVWNFTTAAGGCPPGAAFVVSDNYPAVGETVVFTNKTTGTPPLTYEWAWGDGSPTVADTHPAHVYAQSGDYTVVLTATNPWGVDTAAMEVHADHPPEAAFVVSDSYPAVGETVVFTNTTTGSDPLAYAWDWGDGSPTVTDTHPTHVYAEVGRYAIVLTATNPWGTDTAMAAVAVSGWREVCVPYRIEITGIGMGDRDTAVNPQSLSLAGAADVDWLLAQVAGRYAYDVLPPGQVTLITDAPQFLTLSGPAAETPYGYTFETMLQPTGQVTASVSHPGDVYKTPRGLVLYAHRAMTGAWTSVGRTMNRFVYAGSKEYAHTEVLTFPPLEETTDLYVTAVVIDNDDDDRPMVVEATAGGVTKSVTELGPTDGAGLNVVDLTLPGVLVGTSRVSVTLRSPAGDGDSLVLVGLNVSYPCPAPGGAILHVLPSPAVVPLGTTASLTVSVTPGPAEVNGVQVHGRLDPAYLRLVDARPTGLLPVEIDPLAFDPVTGVFRYGAGCFATAMTEPFGVLVLEVEAVAATEGTLVEFLDEFPTADVSGPGGSVMSQAQDGLVIVPPAPTLWRGGDVKSRPAQPDRR